MQFGTDFAINPKRKRTNCKDKDNFWKNNEKI